jgi:putative membrane protein
MQRILIRFILNAAGFFLAWRLNLFTFSDITTLLIVTLLFGIVNALLHPLLSCLFSLVNLLTLGLFTFIINALLLLVTDWLAAQLNLGFGVVGSTDTQRFISALLGAIVISVVSFVLSIFLREKRGK